MRFPGLPSPATPTTESPPSQPHIPSFFGRRQKFPPRRTKNRGFLLSNERRLHPSFFAVALVGSCFVFVVLFSMPLELRILLIVVAVAPAQLALDIGYNY